jgi:putative oxidoreductase
MRDFALLILRAVFGGLLAGHGAQKLFGWFGGYGLKGTAGWLESMGMKPGKPWAVLAGASEFGGGALTALGALNPLGPLQTIGAMGMATAKTHWGKPIWVTSGGAELPVTNMAIALALGIAGPGKFSVDHALGIKLPRRLILIPGLAIAGASIAAGVLASTKELEQSRPRQAQEQEREREREQARPEMEERPEAVRVPDMPGTLDIAPETTASFEVERVAATEAQAGQAEQATGHPA